jgi:hypothetical protein
MTDLVLALVLARLGHDATLRSLACTLTRAICCPNRLGAI